MAAKKEPLPILRDEALERIGGEEEFLEELLELFREDFGEKRKAIEKALAKRDATALQELGHGLKGAAANLSLPGLREAAIALENAGRADNLEDILAALKKLDSEFARLVAFLD